MEIPDKKSLTSVYSFSGL